MRRVELPGFFPRIGGKHVDQILIYKTKHIIVLSGVHGDIFDKINEVTNGFCPRGSRIAQLA